MSSGSTARKLAKTRSRMTSDPTVPIIASVISPVPLPEDGWPACSASVPVIPACHPAGSAADSARLIPGARLAPPKPLAGAV
jgi:hypothetical protein